MSREVRSAQPAFGTLKSCGDVESIVGGPPWPPSVVEARSGEGHRQRRCFHRLVPGASSGPAGLRRLSSYRAPPGGPGGPGWASSARYLHCSAVHRAATRAAASAHTGSAKSRGQPAGNNQTGMSIRDWMPIRPLGCDGDRLHPHPLPALKSSHATRSSFYAFVALIFHVDSIVAGGLHSPEISA